LNINFDSLVGLSVSLFIIGLFGVMVYEKLNSKKSKTTDLTSNLGRSKNMHE